MSDQAIKTLVSQGLAAMKAGGKVAEKATADIQRDARDPDLKAALEEGNRTSTEWKRRMERAIDEIGGIEGIENQILQAHYDVSKEIRAKAEDDQSRDLGIIAAGQMALHYWIAAFGTMASYASRVGMTQLAQDMKTSVDEAKQADEAHNKLAAKIMQKAA
ncbi:DUF892 family protein [Aureimonas ureilytica]|uniref:DUF892 family protein n=1 Tax=Aureimonas ureilytica TaxID=401562 RepID=UPI00036297EE|nr:DUF892 family protein [Aureimonas ureilytica]